MADTLDIPTSIDDPPLLLLWRVDDLARIVLTLVVGILTAVRAPCSNC